MTYLVLLDEFDRRGALEYQTARLAQAVGGEVSEMPDLDEMRKRFDAALSAAPTASLMDSDDAAIRYALGIKGE